MGFWGAVTGSVQQAGVSAVFPGVGDEGRVHWLFRMPLAVGSRRDRRLGEHVGSSQIWITEHQASKGGVDGSPGVQAA